MGELKYYCNKEKVEANAVEQVEAYAQQEYIQQVCAFTDIHFCDEKAVPVGVAFSSQEYFFPLVTGKDIGCGVMYLKVSKANWLKPFNKNEHYRALNLAHTQMTDDGLGGGNHFLSLEEDEQSIYIICHTGTRNRGIGLYQHCLGLVDNFSLEYGRKVPFVHRSFADDKFFTYYNETLTYGYERRKNFCLKTLLFLLQANYLRGKKELMPKNYLNQNLANAEPRGELYGIEYELRDSIHNHLRFGNKQIIHRKGSTELSKGSVVVIPLSMTRGSLLVSVTSVAQAEEALLSCAHGAGRKLSRFDTMRYWKSSLKEKERREYKNRFSEMLDRSGNFPSGYIQEMDFAYKDHGEIFTHQPYLKKITQTAPIVTIKFSEI
ncbi:MAG: RtcB family protein [Cyclobacteriaceae bacterium]